MKAMVLAAGFGKRMQPLTRRMPKPLIAVAGRTLVDRALDWLAASGIDEAVVNTHYMADMLETHLAGRARPRVMVSHEDAILETGGGVKKALPLLGAAAFVCVNSDTLVVDGAQPALARLRALWDDRAMDALLLVQAVEKSVGYDGPGDFFVNAEGAVRRRLDHARAPYVFTGVQILHPRLFEQAPKGPFSLNLLYNRGMERDGHLPRVRALVHDGAWLHVGDPQGLFSAEEWFRNAR